MHNIGDLVCAGIYIGVIYNIDGDIVTLNCHDGVQHEADIKDLIPVVTAQQLATMFEGGISNVHGAQT